MNYSLEARPYFCKNQQLSAFLYAIIFHLIIFLGYFFYSTYHQTFLSQIPQTIAVSLVAKSSLKSSLSSAHNSNLNYNKSLKNTTHSIAQSTTGKINEDSKLANSAIIEPIFDAKQLNNPSPIYPEVAKARGIEGTVVLKVLVGSNGSALKIEINKSSGSSILDLSALETVKSWRFIPALQNSQNVDSYVLVPIVFKII